MTDIAIPEEAKETLVRRQYERLGAAPFGGWETVPEKYQEAFRDQARKDLQAAAPTLYATWVGGELERMAEETIATCPNDSTCPPCRGFVERLRQRAATLRGGE